MDSAAQPQRPSSALVSAIAEQRRKLLDIGKRNPLTNAPVTKRRKNQLLIVDELSDQVFRLCYREGKSFTFLPRDEDQDDVGDEAVDEILHDNFVPEEQEQELHARHTDTKLQSILTPGDLHTKLLYLFREAKSIEEEQGASVLFLALGFLKYFESESSSVERYAPLVLVPVELTRGDSRGIFRLKARDDDLNANQCLAMMCEEDFDVVIPPLEADGDEWLPSTYYERVREAVAAKPNWVLEPNRMALSFFSFGRFLMYRDLDASQVNSNLVSQLLTGSEQSDAGEGRVNIARPYFDKKLDEIYADPQDLGHILDADTSQTRVIEACANDENMVVQGPPGTGKSQTITNMIAVAVKQGKKVLFVAEKRAALDVVKKRLEKCGLGPLCLELHSHKANRKFIYEDLRTTFELGQPSDTNDQHYKDLANVRDELNRLADLVHAVDSVTGNTAYRLMGRIAYLVGQDIQMIDLDIPEIERWTIAEFDERRGLVDAYADSIARFGLEAKHSWRGLNARLDVLGQQRLNTSVSETKQAIAELIETFDVISETLGLDWPTTEKHCNALATLLAQLSAMPDAVPQLLKTSAIQEHFSASYELFELLDAHGKSRTGLSKSVSQAALDQEWESHLNAIRRAGSSLFRIFNSAYRDAVKQLKLAAVAEVPKQLDARIKLLEELVELGSERRQIESQEGLGNALFGITWQRHSTNVDAHRDALQWVRAQVAAFESPKELDALVTPFQANISTISEPTLRGHIEAYQQASKQLVTITELDIETAFGVESWSDVPLPQINERLGTWQEQFDVIAEYQELRSRGTTLDTMGMAAIRQRINDGSLDPSIAAETFTLLRSQRVLANIFAEHPELQELQNTDRSVLVERFKSLDEELQLLAAQEIAAEHFERIPRGASGKVGIVRGELNKKRKQMPIRKLLDTAGEVIVDLKPIFLMSPLSVAQYLSVDGIKFDLLLIDEASQVKPAEALGCIARASQVIVVGDQKQLPPTSFFDRQIAGDGALEEELDELDEEHVLAQQSADMESVLTLCDARGMQSEMLNWHYRSEHPSLIEVSNVEFYNEKLAFPPSPDATTSHGMQFVHVPDGIYARGKQRNNDIEAEIVCEHVIEYIRANPSMSLGVVTLSTAQRDLIQLKMDHYSRELPEVEAFTARDWDEPFFVKNLENVQGDERDAIYVSIGYGKDQNGYFGQNFGPVSSEGGERRLNVLFTRARRTCKIFASIRHDDIRLDAAKYDGPRVLKRFLKFAETGDLDIPQSLTEEMDSPFEEDVADVLKKHGYTVHPQVGAGGFRIDLAVVNPDDERHYLIAIECDGARYHSSSWARERDRLRQQVLETKGWVFHRIWSTDWFYKRSNEVTRLLDAIEQQRNIIAARSTGQGSFSRNEAFAAKEEAAVTTPTHQSPADPIKRESFREIASVPSEPYEESQLQLSFSQTVVELLDAPINAIVQLVKEVVGNEGPVHSEIVIDRVRSAWGLKSTGRRIREHVLMAISQALKHGQIASLSRRSEFLVLRDASQLTRPLRDRSDVQTAKLKDPDYIPPTELMACLSEVVQANVAISIEDATKEVSRILGTNRRRDRMHELVAECGQALVNTNKITREGDLLNRVKDV
ncbi:MAG: DUF3320 domain-containing protein [Gammaproteobacteria bacterium]|nr:DUF3320 domain-containing protein [Gammaproteobacteria bacterium]